MRKGSVTCIADAEDERRLIALTNRVPFDDRICHVTEGRNTGFPKIYRAMRSNGSPVPQFETDDRNLHFMATIPIHPMFLGEDSAENVTKNVTKNEPKKMTERQRKILALVKSEPFITLVQIANMLKVSKSTIKRDLEKLSAYLVHIGPKNGGHWEIV